MQQRTMKKCLFVDYLFFLNIVFSHNYMYITIYQKIQGLELIWIDVSFGFIWGFVSELEKYLLEIKDPQ